MKNAIIRLFRIDPEHFDLMDIEDGEIWYSPSINALVLGKDGKKNILPCSKVEEFFDIKDEGVIVTDSLEEPKMGKRASAKLSVKKKSCPSWAYGKPETTPEDGSDHLITLLKKLSAKAFVHDLIQSIVCDKYMQLDHPLSFKGEQITSIDDLVIKIKCALESSDWDYTSLESILNFYMNNIKKDIENGFIEFKPFKH